MVTSHELVSDIHTLSQLQRDFFIQRWSTPGMIFFPYFHKAAHRSKNNSIKAIYTTLSDHIEKRKGTCVTAPEPIDLLLEHKLSMQDIFGLVFGALFGGVFNVSKTGM
jgi:hypothetical protein